MSSVVVTQDLIDRTFEIFRRCGGAELECVVFWTGPRDDASVNDDLHHPDHDSNSHGYAVDSNWLNTFFRDLYERGRSARAQVHTHPAAAFHSVTDDKHALVPAPGFISIVIPDFAQGQIGFESAAMYRLSDAGVWVKGDVSDIAVR